MQYDWQAIFFDFDGVIVDTTKMKTAAFLSMYADHTDEVKRDVVAYHRLHGGISRWVKFRHFEEQILGRAPDEARVAALAGEYSQRVCDLVVSADFIPGARETLESLAAAELPTFVVSGTPQEELDRIVDARGMRGLFTEVHGSPRLKPVIVRDVLARRGYAPERCLFYGDAPTDYKAAAECGLAFLGVEPPGESHPFPEGTAVTRRVYLPTTAFFELV